MKKLILLKLFSVIYVYAYAQHTGSEQKNDRIESLKIAFVTEKLDLSSSEAKAFWPVYFEFNSQLKKIRSKEKENAKVLKTKPNITDQESEKFLAEQLSLKQQQLDLTKKYLVEFKKVLPVKKVARMLMLEQEFKQELLGKLKDKAH